LQDVSSNAISSTTSTTWQTKLSITVSGFTGVLRVGRSMEFNSASNNKGVAVRFQNTTDNVTLGYSEQQTNNSTNWFGFSGFSYVTFNGTSKTFELQYRRIDTTTCNVQNARIEIWRVS
jgi:hypothetical protein